MPGAPSDPGAQVEGADAENNTVEGRWWKLVLAVGLAACAVLPFAGSFQEVASLAVVVAALAAAVRGIRRWSDRPSPWWLVVLGAVLHLVAVVVNAVVAAVTGVADPYPSIADPLFVLGYFAMIAGAFRFIRFRTVRTERDHLLDALIVAVGATLVAWTLLLSPYVRDSSVPFTERLLGIGYSTILLVLLAAITRVAVGPGARNPSYYFLAAAAGLTFLNDVVATVQTTTTVYADVRAVITPVAFVLFATSANHPSMGRITDPPDDVETPLTRRRQLLLGGALLVPSLVIVWNSARGERIDIPVLLAGTLALAFLVVARLAALVRDKERRADHEGVLRRAATALVTATSRDEILSGALVAVHSLTERIEASRASVLLGDLDELEVSASVGRRADEARGTRVTARARSSPILEGLRTRTSVAVRDEPALDLPDTRSAEPYQVLVPLVSQNELRGAIAVCSSEAMSLLTRQDLERLAAQVALALESASLTEEFHRRRSERRFRALVENSSDLVTVLDDLGAVTFASPAVARLLGRDEIELMREGLEAVLHEEDRPRLAQLLEESRDALEPGGPVELRLRHQDGTYRWFEAVVRDLSHDDDIDGFVVTAREISDRKRAEQRVARSEARFRSLVQNSSDVVAVVDDSAFFTYVSPSIGNVLGFRPDELVGTSVISLLPPDEVNRTLHLLERLGDDRFEQLSEEVHIRSRLGQWHTLDVTVTDLREEPAVEGIVLNARDVSDRKRLEDNLRRQALSDALTGLGNRTLLIDRVDAALDEHDPGHHDGAVAVLFIDLDDFKTVNDSLGHAKGDELLVLVAERITAGLRAGDVAARLGGDEFAVMLDGVVSDAEALDVAERIIAALGAPFEIHGRTLQITTSIGIALSSDEAASAEVLLRNADMAMYTAKEQGKRRAMVFREEMHASVFERLELKTDLSQGIDRDELVLFYQPIVSLDRGRIVEVEALVRWEHPTRGMLSPDMFIPLAEETGLVMPLGRWVLNEACRQLAEWQAEPGLAEVPRMSVNVSVHQLRDGSIVDDVAAALRRNDVEADMLDLEITESTLLVDDDETRTTLEELRTLGVRLSVDDFGTGYSSLGYINQFPVDVLKIDRSFVDALGREADGESGVVPTIVELAQRLDLHTVAEGIEGAEQLAILQRIGVELGQGYYFSRPVPAPELRRLLGREMEVTRSPDVERLAAG